MQKRENDDVRAQARRAGLLLLLEDYTPVNPVDTQTFLNAMLDNYVTPQSRQTMWRQIADLHAWVTALEGGYSDASTADDDPQLALEYAEAELAALLDLAAGVSPTTAARAA